LPGACGEPGSRHPEPGAPPRWGDAGTEGTLGEDDARARERVRDTSSVGERTNRRVDADRRGSHGKGPVVMLSQGIRGVSSFQHGRAYARVSRVGRWTWRIQVLVPVSGDGLGDAEVDTTDVFGRNRVARIARRIVNRYVRKHTLEAGPGFEVRGGGSG